MLPRLMCTIQGELSPAAAVRAAAVLIHWTTGKRSVPTARGQIFTLSAFVEISHILKAAALFLFVSEFSTIKTIELLQWVSVTSQVG